MSHWLRQPVWLEIAIELVLVVGLLAAGILMLWVYQAKQQLWSSRLAELSSSQVGAQFQISELESQLRILLCITVVSCLVVVLAIGILAKDLLARASQSLR